MSQAGEVARKLGADIMAYSSLMEYVTLSGRHPLDVLEVIRARARSGSRADGHRVALVVEGGAMRGVYTSGALVALHAIGLSSLFDDVYGTSAGAVNAAHFLSGMGDSKADTYYRLLTDGRFLNPYRVRKIVDIDFFVDQVLTDLRPMEVAKVMKSPSRLWVAVADYTKAQQLLLNAQTCGYPFLQVLKAATAMPVLYNKLVQLGDSSAFDTGFCNPFPLNEALSMGASHVLVLLSKPINYVTPAETWWERGLIRYRFAGGNRSIIQMFAQSAAACNRLRDLAHGRETSSSSSDTAIATIAPAIWEVGQSCRDVDLLRSATINSARGTLRVFGHAEHKLDEWVASGRI